jgi:hypothetical protein
MPPTQAAYNELAKAVYNMEGRFDTFEEMLQKILTERQATVTLRIEGTEDRLSVLESAPARHRDRIHTWATALCAGSFAGIGASIIAHLKIG